MLRGEAEHLAGAIAMPKLPALSSRVFHEDEMKTLRCLIIVLASLVVLSLFWRPDSNSNSNSNGSGSALAQGCLLCHKYMGLGRVEEGEADNHTFKSYYVDEQLLRESVHGGVECTACHQSVERIPHVDPETAACPSSCHPDRSVVEKGFSHSSDVKAEEDLAFRPQENDPLCRRCHGHYAHTLSASIRAILNQHSRFISCETCHIRSADLPDGEITFSWFDLAEKTPQAPDRQSGPNGCLSRIVPVISSQEGRQLSHNQLLLDDPAVERLIQRREPLAGSDLAALKTKVHQMSEIPVLCMDCHQREYLPLQALGYSQSRIALLKSQELAEYGQNYMDFYFPSILDHDLMRQLDYNGVAAGEAVEYEMLMDAPPPPPAPLEEIASESKPKSETEGETKVSTWKRSKAAANSARIKLGDNEELPIRGSRINVRIDGFRARVLIDSYFYNDRDRQFEGTFQLRLPNGASPYFLAFGSTKLTSEADLSKLLQEEGERDQSAQWPPEQIMLDRKESWDKPKQARMVTKEKAAFAYRETVRRRVDPALMEWSGADVFNARIFPIFPKKFHRVVIGYDVDLIQAGNALEYRLELPPETPETTVNINAAEISGAVAKMMPEAKAVRKDGRVLYSFENPLETELVLRFENVKTVLLSGQDLETGPYFAARFRPDLPVSKASGSSSAVFLVDVSLSSNPDRFNVWLKLMEEILSANQDELKRFGVLFFNIESFWWKEAFVDNNAENVSSLMEYANTLALEGATDLGAALKEASQPSWLKSPSNESTDLFLLSDGSATWGEGDLYALSAVLDGLDGALFAYQTGLPGTDARMLSHLARESGGAVFSMAGEAAEIPSAAKAHRSRPWELMGVETAGGSDILLAGRPTALFPGQTLLLAGRGIPERSAPVRLKLRQGEHVETVEIQMPEFIESDLAPRIYGQIAVNQLEEFKEITQPESEAYARHFRIPGQTCSLLMLESEEDYQRFNIKPEEDAFVVKSTKAYDLVVGALQTAKSFLGDAKAAFMNWLEKMKEFPGVDLDISAAFKMTLDKMPKASFQVQPAELTSSERRAAELPGLIREQLASRKIDYNAMTLEAKRRREKYGSADALKALSTLIENRPGDAALARDVGFSAMEMGLGGQAYHLFRRVAQSRPFEPQTYRAMALCLTEMGMPDLALAYYEVGLAGQWGHRFGEFRRILGLDYLRFLQQIEKGELKTSAPDFASARLKTIGKEFDLGKADLLVSIAWNTDGTDIDLHVSEPTGEECFYDHPATKIGGKITRDVTQGYGPEMYVLPNAVKGDFKIRVKYFASDQTRASTRTKVFVSIFKNWGTDLETVEQKTVTLEYGKEMHDLAVVKFE